jgi:hypothetical protein
LFPFQPQESGDSARVAEAGMWHPKGVLMASLTEHTQAVNVLAMVNLLMP